MIIFHLHRQRRTVTLFDDPDEEPELEFDDLDPNKLKRADGSASASASGSAYAFASARAYANTARKAPTNNHKIFIMTKLFHFQKETKKLLQNQFFDYRFIRKFTKNSLKLSIQFFCTKT